jgi:multimeric flavodoxin WrbA
MNKYFTINAMPVVSSTYWNHTHGREPEDVLKDLEGMMTMRNIGKNMAWLMKCIELAKSGGLDHPVNQRAVTDFIQPQH